jgi:hypothetical protein
LNATVTSIEDHGYLLSFGVPAMSGFLLHSNYMDGKLFMSKNLYSDLVLNSYFRLGESLQLSINVVFFILLLLVM